MLGGRRRETRCSCLRLHSSSSINAHRASGERNVGSHQRSAAAVAAAGGNDAVGASVARPALSLSLSLMQGKIRK